MSRNHNEFKREVPLLLTAKQPSASIYGALPFVNLDLSNVRGEPTFWDVPATGGYGGGCDTGRAMAQAYMKVQRHCCYTNMGDLVQGVISFMNRIEQEGGLTAFHDSQDSNNGMDALRGQMVGFFAEIERLAETGARSVAGAKLDAITEAQLLEDANNGLQCDWVAYMDSLREKDKAAGIAQEGEDNE
jgi:hypothetical protein